MASKLQSMMIHRDIKPSNIVTSNDGVVKLIDFNATKQFNCGQNEDTRLMGTQKFAARNNTASDSLIRGRISMELELPCII